MQEESKFLNLKGGSMNNFHHLDNYREWTKRLSLTVMNTIVRKNMLRWVALTFDNATSDKECGS